MVLDTVEISLISSGIVLRHDESVRESISCHFPYLMDYHIHPLFISYERIGGHIISAIKFNMLVLPERGTDSLE
jgi:hypothetical protein